MMKNIISFDFFNKLYGFELFFEEQTERIFAILHSREIKMLHFCNGKYMGNCLKYKLETMCHRVFKKRLGFQQNVR